MSYDLRIWSRKFVDIVLDIKLSDQEISISPNIRVEQEYIPTEIVCFVVYGAKDTAQRYVCENRQLYSGGDSFARVRIYA